VDSGAITVGGHNVREFTCDSLMKNFTNNICFGKPDATEDEIIAAAKAACCHEFISAYTEGYDTMVRRRRIFSFRR